MRGSDVSPDTSSEIFSDLMTGNSRNKGTELSTAFESAEKSIYYFLHKKESSCRSSLFYRLNPAHQPEHTAAEKEREFALTVFGPPGTTTFELCGGLKIRDRDLSVVIAAVIIGNNYPIIIQNDLVYEGVDEPPAVFRIVDVAALEKLHPGDDRFPG